MCVASSNVATCLQDYEWVVGTTVTGLDGRSGILGMSTGLYTGDASPTKLVIKALDDANIITDPVFGFALYGSGK